MTGDRRSPTWVERLNEAGKRPGFAKATRVQGLLREFALFSNESDPSLVAEAVMKHEVASIRKNIRAVEKWISHLESHLGAREGAE